MINKDFHYIYFDEQQDTGMTYNFKLINYICVISSLLCKPDNIYFWHNYKTIPDNNLFNKMKEKGVQFRYLEPPTEIFGNPIKHVQHKADVARLKILKEYGGVYADLDLIFCNPIDDLLNSKNVLCRENLKNIGLAIIMAQKDSKFINDWLESYKDFEGSKYIGHKELKKLKDKEEKKKQLDYYLTNSVYNLTELTKNNNVLILPRQAFYEPKQFFMDYNKFFELENYKGSYGHHLWISTNNNLLRLTGKQIQEKLDKYFYRLCLQILRI